MATRVSRVGRVLSTRTVTCPTDCRPWLLMAVQVRTVPVVSERMTVVSHPLFDGTSDCGSETSHVTVTSELFQPRALGVGGSETLMSGGVESPDRGRLVAVGVAVGDEVAVAVVITVGVSVAVGVSVGMGDAVGVDVEVTVDVAVTLTVWVGVIVSGVASGVSVASGCVSGPPGGGVVVASDVGVVSD